MIHFCKRSERCTHNLTLVCNIIYFTAEILELAGNAARDNKKGRVTPRHILLAVANDEELHQLLRQVTIASGGVLPKIHPELLMKKRGSRINRPILVDGPPQLTKSPKTVAARKEVIIKKPPKLQAKGKKLAAFAKGKKVSGLNLQLSPSIG